MSRFQTTLGGICRVKNGGLALHFGVESAKNLSVVTTYVNKTKINNQLLLTQFISSLSQTVSENKLVAAAETLKIKAGKPLTSRDFKIMTERIANFDGVGNAQKMPRRVQINIWPYENKSHFGHASITVNNAIAKDSPTHISWWPGTSSSGKYDSYFKQRDALPNKSYQMDAVSEISDRAKNKLSGFDEIRTLRKEGGLSKNFSESLQIAIDDKMSDIFNVLQEKIAIEKDNNTDFLTLSTNEQKKILIHATEEDANRRNFAAEKSENIIDTQRRIFIEKISTYLANTILDTALNVSEQGITEAFTAKGRKNLFNSAKESIFTDETVKKLQNEALSAVLKSGRFMPRARQEKDDNGGWIVNSEKVFLPLRGQQGKETFALFGLDEHGIQTYWTDIQNKMKKKEIGYTLVSTTNNCSGMAAGVLAAGGAGAFIPFKSSILVETPNDIHSYALAVQCRVDSLNQQSTQIQKFYKREQKNPALNFINGQPTADASIATLRESINQAINAMSFAEKKRFYALENAVRHIPEQGTGQKELTKSCIELVETLSNLLEKPLPSPQNKAVSRALFSAAAMRESLEKMMKNSIASGF